MLVSPNVAKQHLCKIFKRSDLPLETRQLLNQEVKNFNKQFTFLDKTRNLFGQYAHLYIFLDTVKHLSSQGFSLDFQSIVCAKINYDLIPYIRNINKRKVSLLVQKLKTKNIANPLELEYAAKKQFTRMGMPFYPQLHPKGVKMIIENCDYPKSFETGFILNSKLNMRCKKLLSFTRNILHFKRKNKNKLMPQFIDT